MSETKTELAHEVVPASATPVVNAASAACIASSGSTSVPSAGPALPLRRSASRDTPRSAKRKQARDQSLERIAGLEKELDAVRGLLGESNKRASAFKAALAEERKKAPPATPEQSKPDRPAASETHSDDDDVEGSGATFTPPPKAPGVEIFSVPLAFYNWCGSLSKFVWAVLCACTGCCDFVDVVLRGVVAVAVYRGYWALGLLLVQPWHHSISGRYELRVAVPLFRLCLAVVSVVLQLLNANYQTVEGFIVRGYLYAYPNAAWYAGPIMYFGRHDLLLTYQATFVMDMVRLVWQWAYPVMQCALLLAAPFFPNLFRDPVGTLQEMVTNFMVTHPEADSEALAYIANRLYGVDFAKVDFHLLFGALRDWLMKSNPLIDQLSILKHINDAQTFIGTLSMGRHFAHALDTESFVRDCDIGSNAINGMLPSGRRMLRK